MSNAKDPWTLVINALPGPVSARLVVQYLLGALHNQFVTTTVVASKMARASLLIGVVKPSVAVIGVVKPSVAIIGIVTLTVDVTKSLQWLFVPAGTDGFSVGGALITERG
ncbi:MAG: hypothetical protein L6R36_004954 [Xanthoria steineri]|nr:MAG: hypothetical protein L6R36_004954 [Xanthoria steineri]